MPQIFVSLPVTDLERSKAFYTALGFPLNPVFSDHNAACVIVEDGHSYFMLMVRDFLQTFTELPLGDPAVSPYTQTSVFVDSREAVDRACANGIAAGGTEANPPTDLGFMYQRQLADPDGNIIEFGFMEHGAAEPSPDAVLSHSA